ncbi:MAG: ergothioneine biosynthesis protein EgtB [Microthrixaceae bacterium]
MTALDGNNTHPLASAEILPEGATQLQNLSWVRNLTEQLAAPLSPEDQTVQSMPDASPTKWHRAHTTWFFETFLLQPFLEGYQSYNEEFGFLFNSYYEAMGSRHSRGERGLVSRPSTTEIGSYRQHVDTALEKLLQRNSSDRVAELTLLGLHHEQQHQELLCMDALHMLSRHPFRPAYAQPQLPAPQPTQVALPQTQGWIQFVGGLQQMGCEKPALHSVDAEHSENLSDSDLHFSFDNESPRHEVLLHPFEIADRLITCAEWLEFILDGGYLRSELWMSEGWAQLAAASQSMPAYWQVSNGEYKSFGLTGNQPVQLHQPVSNISWFEADAFARWSGARLPTEAEWETAAGTPPPGAHLDLEVLFPRTASASPDSQQWFGELWQWTESPYRPYPGYRAAAGAIGEYNGKFMINQQVLRGSSFATPAGHARSTYRNFFSPSSSWMFSGLRLARDL